MNASTTLVKFADSPGTLENRDRSFVEWHGGRPFYYCWAVMVDHPVWLDAVRRAAVELSSWLVPDYVRQGHVTILPAGFGEEKLDGAGLAEVAKSVAPFSLALGPLGSFTSSPCFEIADPSAGLLSLRQALRPILFDQNSEVRDADYQPHLTVGLYRACFPTQPILQRIREFPVADYSRIEVTEISLCAYETHTIKGPLMPIARIGLGSGRLTILDHHFLFR